MLRILIMITVFVVIGPPFLVVLGMWELSKLLFFSKSHRRHNRFMREFKKTYKHHIPYTAMTASQSRRKF